MAFRTAAFALIAAAALGCGPGRPPAIAPEVSSSREARELQRAIDAALDGPALQRSTWGIAVRSLSGGDLLYSRNARKLLLPASNAKVITLAAAAERLGWDFSFETTLGALGPIDGGVLYGDLVVTGSGDPTVDDWAGDATRLFTAWASELRARGITAVTGRIVGNDNLLPDQLLGSGWAWDDLDRSFATAVGALQFNQNTARLTVAPGAAAGQPAILSIEPEGSGLTLRNGVVTGEAAMPVTLQSRRGAGSPLLEVRGSVPIGSSPLVRNVSAYNPTTYFAGALRDRLIAAGITIRGGAIDVDDLHDPQVLDRQTPLLTHRSPPLSAVATTMMKVSQNLFAETLLQVAGGPAAVRAALTAWGIEENAVVVADGSGLSRYNLATPEALVAILARVYRDERLRGPFEASLPIAGRDGTLATRLAGTAAEGNARAKTGAFSNARGLSGYVRAADGEPLVFAILANNFGTTPAIIEDAADAIVVLLAEFRRKRM